jgi:hypothetical protein
VTQESILQHVKRFAEIDDVFSPDFLSPTIIVQWGNASSSENLDPIRLNKLHSCLSWDVQKVIYLHSFADGTTLPSGPYFLNRGRLCEAWKLYPDELASFQTTVVSDPSEPYR